MSATLHLSRVRLRALHGEALSAIAPLLIPADKNQRVGHSHHIVWLLFQEFPDAARDFLWRDEGNGRYMILSHSPPTDPHSLFEVETRLFEPHLAKGDHLAFVMRANPAMASKSALDAAQREKRQRGKRVDVVMHALFNAHSQQERKHLHEVGELAPLRDKIVAVEGDKWRAAQGESYGFSLVADTIVLDGYEQVPVERHRGRPAGFSKLDMAGKLAIADPALFLAKLARGFGAAKAFGNGLMLIRRA